MAQFEPAYNITARWEGGYQSHSSDTGNYNSRGQLVGTNWGISAPVYEDWINRPPTTADMRNMSEATAKQIYRAKFWNAIQGDRINSQDVANILYDGRVNHGYTGVKLMQGVLGIAKDGSVGPVTLAAINAANPAQLFNRYKQAREDFYKQLANNNPSYQAFLTGWLNRIRSFDFGGAVAVVASSNLLVLLAVGAWLFTTKKITL